MSARTYLSIGDVLSLLREEFPDVTISKIRFLESQGLVNPERSPSGYRKFFEQDVARLRWVLRQQREHFLPLKVIRDRLMQLGDGDPIPDDLPAAAQGQGDANIIVQSSSDLLGIPSDEASITARASQHGADSGTLGLRAERQPNGTAPGPIMEPTNAPGLRAATTRGEPKAASRHDFPMPSHVASSDRAVLSPSFPSVSSPASSAPAARTIERDATAPGAKKGIADGPGLGERTPARPAQGQARLEQHAEGQPLASSLREERATSLARSTGSPAVEVEHRGPTDSMHEMVSRLPGLPGDSSRSGPASSGASVPAAGKLAGRVDALSGASFTAEELAAASGLSVEVVSGLEAAGMLSSLMVAGTAYYDEEALVVARLVAGMGKFGIEPRHLRLYRNAIDREVGLVEQVIAPLLRQRNPESRQRAVETAAEIVELGENLRSALLRQEFRRQFGV